MPGRLEGKVAIVTGAGRGIGKAIAVSLGAEGAAVVLASRTKDSLCETARAVEAAGGKAVVVPTDVADEEAIKNLVAVTKKQLGRLDILVNNAGVVHSSPLEHTATEDWDRCMTINARGPFILCREAIPMLRDADRGYIINMCSFVGVRAYPNQSAYGASKHALRGMSMALAQELRADNIRVHVICPGGVATDMIKDVRPELKSEDLMTPDEIAELVLYLVTHKGNAVIDELHLRRTAASPWF